MTCRLGRRTQAGARLQRATRTRLREQWRARLDRPHSEIFVLYGDAGSAAGNYSARIMLLDNGAGDAVELRVLAFSRHSSAGKAAVSIAVRGFVNNRELFGWAMSPGSAVTRGPCHIQRRKPRRSLQPPGQHRLLFRRAPRWAVPTGDVKRPANDAKANVRPWCRPQLLIASPGLS